VEKVVQTIRYKDPSTHNPRVWFQFVAKVSYVVVMFREVPHYTLLSRKNVSRERIDRSRHRALRLGMHSRVRFVTNLREFGCDFFPVCQVCLSLPVVGVELVGCCVASSRIAKRVVRMRRRWPLRLGETEKLTEWPLSH